MLSALQRGLFDNPLRVQLQLGFQRFGQRFPQFGHPLPKWQEVLEVDLLYIDHQWIWGPDGVPMPIVSLGDFAPKMPIQLRDRVSCPGFGNYGIGDFMAAPS